MMTTAFKDDQFFKGGLIFFTTHQFAILTKLFS